MLLPMGIGNFNAYGKEGPVQLKLLCIDVTSFTKARPEPEVLL